MKQCIPACQQVAIMPHHFITNPSEVYCSIYCSQIVDTSIYINASTETQENQLMNGNTFAKLKVCENFSSTC
jgi:hypothetical protein